MKRASQLARSVVGLVLLGAAACGGGGDGDEGTGAPAASSSTGTAQELTIRGVEQGEQYLFDPKDVRARPGTVRIRFDNSSAERQHSLVVQRPGGGGNLASTDEVDAGRSKTIEFTLTEEGSYKLVCLLRGHEARGMVGTLTVARQ